MAKKINQSQSERDLLRLIKLYVFRISENLGPSGDVINNINQNTTRIGWTTIPGNSVTYSYYSGIVAGNPSGNTSNVETATFSDGSGTVFTQTFTYNLTDKVLTIITT